jgi:Domain of unknown function (DUF4262)
VNNDPSLEKLRRDIEAVGWHVILVPSDEEGPGFGFTVGLHQTFQHPEFLLFGLKLEVMHSILNRLGDKVREGTVFSAHDQIDGIVQRYSVTLLPVEKHSYPTYLGTALRHYGNDGFGAFQCLWPDKLGRFPMDPKCQSVVQALQPLLGW